MKVAMDLHHGSDAPDRWPLAERESATEWPATSPLQQEWIWEGSGKRCFGLRCLRATAAIEIGGERVGVAEQRGVLVMACSRLSPALPAASKGLRRREKEGDLASLY